MVPSGGGRSKERIVTGGGENVAPRLFSFRRQSRQDSIPYIVPGTTRLFIEKYWFKQVSILNFFLKLFYARLMWSCLL